MRGPVLGKEFQGIGAAGVKVKPDRERFARLAVGAHLLDVPVALGSVMEATWSDVVRLHGVDELIGGVAAPGELLGCGRPDDGELDE